MRTPIWSKGQRGKEGLWERGYGGLWDTHMEGLMMMGANGDTHMPHACAALHFTRAMPVDPCRPCAAAGVHSTMRAASR